MKSVPSVTSSSSGITTTRRLRIKPSSNKILEEEKQLQEVLQRRGPPTEVSYTSATSNDQILDDTLRVSPRADDHLLQRIAELEQTVFDQAQQIRNLQGVVNTSNVNIQNLNDLIQLKNGIINNLQSQQDRQLQCPNCLTADTRVQDLLQQVKAKDQSLQSLQKTLDSANKKLLESNNKQQEMLSRHAIEIKSRDDTINSLKVDTRVQDLLQQVQAKNNSIQSLQKSIDCLNKKLLESSNRQQETLERDIKETEQQKPVQPVQQHTKLCNNKKQQIQIRKGFENGCPCDYYYYGDETEPFECKKFNYHGRVVEHWFCNNGKKEGEYKKWHGNGLLKEQCFYNNGNIEGQHKKWYESGQGQEQGYGQLESLCFYKNGKREGEYKSWTVTGKLMTHGFYRDGKSDGEQKSWHTNGQLAQQCFYMNGILQGEIKKWNYSGFPMK